MDRLISSPDRDARLQRVLHELERRFGSWVIYRLKDRLIHEEAAEASNRAISSGSLALDLAVGVGGFPRGCITELVGPPSSGRSILSSHLLASAQHENGFVTFVDATHSADLEQMQRCGVRLADLLLVVPQTLSEALEVATLLIESNGLDALALGPLDDLFGSASVAGRLAATHLARLNAALRSSPTAVVVVTDQVSRPSFSSANAALRHFASLRIQLTPLRPLVHPSGDLLGLRVRAEVVKNKLAPPRHAIELDLRRDRGVHREAELVDLGLATQVLVESSLGICFGSDVLGRGRSRAIATLENEPRLAATLADMIRRSGGT